MPACEPAPTCGMRRRNKSGPGRLLVLLTTMTTLMLVIGVFGVFGLSGCERPPKVDPRVAGEHAEVRARYHADRTKRRADEMIFLHPNSERQRSARKAQLMLDELIERSPGRTSSASSRDSAVDSQKEPATMEKR